MSVLFHDNSFSVSTLPTPLTLPKTSSFMTQHYRRWLSTPYNTTFVPQTEKPTIQDSLLKNYLVFALVKIVIA